VKEPYEERRMSSFDKDEVKTIHFNGSSTKKTYVDD
jgi:hypothetical protein